MFIKFGEPVPWSVLSMESTIIILIIAIINTEPIYELIWIKIEFPKDVVLC